MSHGGGRRGGAHEEEHENHERWLVSYADMITVLMALFIVLYAMSQVDENKYEALRDGLSQAFGHEIASAKARPVLDEAGESMMVFAGIPVSTQMSQTQQEAIEREVDRRGQQAVQRTVAATQSEAKRLDDVQARLTKALKAHGLDDDVEMMIDDRGLVVSLVSRHVTFDNDRATLTRRGKLIIDTLAPVLADLDDQLSIDGHTNQVPVKPAYFATDWDLSVARAVAVVRRLNEVNGIAEDRLVAAGYGHTRPLRDPKEPGSQEVNKRVDIVIRTALTGTAQGLLSEVANDQIIPEALPSTTPSTTPEGES